ncbi:aminoacetone oxidase family FAD-binding enzyme [Candidatus Marinamargulisbacteria bacterium SCGC AAA071-K20]|nr:aminoacetone oxidase family FAD-binding enzyme [Candidatus Marinamargulisbacteria bacterium SCGC AAA071-K20]
MTTINEIKKIDIVVIGGGAAGFFSAIQAAALGKSVVILEQYKNVLSKVKVSGGGRCNVTYSCFEPRSLAEHYPRGGKALIGVFHKFQPADTVNWFEERGVTLKTEDDGRLFPDTDSSQTIIDCLINEAKKLGVSILTKRSVVDISKKSDRFNIELNDGSGYDCMGVIITTGSSKVGYEFAKNFGHTIIDPVPSLFTFKINDEKLHELAGVSVKEVEVNIDGKKQFTQKGPLLVTHWGLSGPSVIKLSAWAARYAAEQKYQFDVTINLLPNLTQPSIGNAITEFKKNNPLKQCARQSPFSQFSARFWLYLVEKVEIKPDQPNKHLTEKQIQSLVAVISKLSFKVSGKSPFKEEFVTAGGVSLNEIDFKTMESKRCKGLFFAGEILDIDGVTGGFNFQNAWSTGYIAGSSV